MQGVYGNSSSAQFCWELKTALKRQFNFLKDRETMAIIFGEGLDIYCLLFSL